jgi:hypothetical protein
MDLDVFKWIWMFKGHKMYSDTVGKIEQMESLNSNRPKWHLDLAVLVNSNRFRWIDPDWYIRGLIIVNFNILAQKSQAQVCTDKIQTTHSSLFTVLCFGELCVQMGSDVCKKTSELSWININANRFSKIPMKFHGLKTNNIN